MMKVFLSQSFKLSLAITTNFTLLPLILMGVSVQSISGVFVDDATAQPLSYREQRKKDADKIVSLIRGRSREISHREQEKKYRQALAIYKEIGDRQNEVRSLIRLAELDAVRFRHGKAVETLKLAIKIAQSLGDGKSEFEILCSGIRVGSLIHMEEMNIFSYLISRDPSSINLDERLISLANSNSYLAYSDRYQRNYDIKLSYIYSDLGHIYVDKKLYTKAISAYKRAIAEFRKETSKYSVYRQYDLLVEIGITYKLMGEEIQSLAALDEAQVFYERLFAENLENFGKAGENLSTFINITVTKNSDALLQKVLHLYADFISKKRGISNSSYTDVIGSYTLENVGKAYERIGKYDLAIKYYKQGLVASGNFSFGLLHRIARMYVQLGNDSDALQAYLLALRELMRVRADIRRNSQCGGAGLLIDIGKFYTRMGERDKAKTFYQEADEILNSCDALFAKLGGPSGSVSVLTDEDDLDKLLPSSSTEGKPEPSVQEPKSKS